ncbi:hypothetical protein JCM19045_3748 [Bacillus sp. JCM 19045]|nr:hypothetical protein JCM19045_3748 [Bacillus sp. JCM 19045]
MKRIIGGVKRWKNNDQQKKSINLKLNEMRKEEEEYRREAFIEIYEEYISLLEDEIDRLKK